MQRCVPSADSEAGLLSGRYLCFRQTFSFFLYRRIPVLCLPEDHVKPTQPATCISWKQDIHRLLCNSADSCSMFQLYAYGHCYGYED